MSRTIVQIAVIAAAAGAVSALWVLRESGADGWETIGAVCADCHNDTDLAGDVSFTGMTPDSIAVHPEVFETVVQRLRGNLMPPPGGPVVDSAQIDALISQVEAELDRNAQPLVGHVRAQRMTRTEYAHAIEGLLGVEIDPVEYLPTEIEVEGFTNVASALSVSPMFIEQYVGVAQTVAHLAVGEPVPKLAAATYASSGGGRGGGGYIDGFPLGTRSGIRFSHNFPADGEYRLSLGSVASVGYPAALAHEHTMVILVDGVEVHHDTLGGESDLELAHAGGAPGVAEINARFNDVPVQFEAGVHEVVITFIERSRASSDAMLGRGSQSAPGIGGSVDLVGPHNATGISRTRSRELIFVCTPEVPARERECAEQIAVNLIERAFRRPVTAEDLERLMPFYEEGRTGLGGFDEGIEMIVAAAIASPDFLYRTIKPAADETAPRYALDDYELATRLSFFLWSQGPDEELLSLASEGALSTPGALAAQAGRLLTDPRAEVLVENFALTWLDVDDLSAVQPDPDIFAGQFSDGLRSDFAEEIERFVGSILFGDIDVRSLLTADHTFLNENLARHYGIDSVHGQQVRRVELEDPVRHGLLGKGAVQLMTSYGDRTSPVLRGAWVLEKLMGTPPTPPPPGVETDLSNPEGEEPKTIRARLEQHRENPNCGACHGAIDPYGLALENFNVTGSWRDTDRDARAPIDASSVLPGGTEINGPVELVAALQDRPDQFVQALTEKLLMYALGRELEYFDMPTVRRIVRAAEAEDYRFAAIVAGIVESDAFRMQMNEG